MRVLRIPCNKIWFEKIKNGEIHNDYREIKPYWTQRLVEPDILKGGIKSRTYDVVEFFVGYHKFAPTLRYKFLGLSIQSLFDNGNFYIIHFGDLIT